MRGESLGSLGSGLGFLPLFVGTLPLFVGTLPFFVGTLSLNRRDSGLLRRAFNRDLGLSLIGLALLNPFRKRQESVPRPARRS